MMLFPEPASQIGNVQFEELVEEVMKKDVRLPWTHRREPVDIQSMNML
jgi:hypothetical protein